MSKIQKINIYVGTVGSAYIDKETALKNVEAARKNISDVENIISKAEDIKGNLINSISAADDAKSRATLVKNRLASAISDFKNKNAVIYAQLLELKEQVEANDVDGIYKNGGNVKTAANNISNAENQIDEIIKIIESAEVLLEDNKKLLRIREQEYKEAIGEFTQYVPDVEFNIDDLSNNEEDYLNNRINEINDNINIINDVTDHINDYSEETNNIIDSIINGTNTDNPTDDEGNKLYWYAGQVMPSAQYYESDNDNFVVTEDSVNTWHELTLINDTLNGEQIFKLLAGINSLSNTTKWYVLVPESLSLNPVMSDMTTPDSRFVPGTNLTTVNGVSYILYTVNNEIPASEGVSGSRLNMIMIGGYGDFTLDIHLDRCTYLITTNAKDIYHYNDEITLTLTVVEEDIDLYDLPDRSELSLRGLDIISYDKSQGYTGTLRVRFNGRNNGYISGSVKRINMYYFGYSTFNDNVLEYTNDKPTAPGNLFNTLSSSRGKCPINFTQGFNYGDGINQVPDENASNQNIYIIVPQIYYDVNNNTYLDDDDTRWKMMAGTSGFERQVQTTEDASTTKMIYTVTYGGVNYYVLCISTEGISGHQSFNQSGAPVTPVTPVTTDGNYWYIGKTAPTIPYNPENNLVTDNVSLGWRKIEGDLNNYVESNPYWNGQGISLLGDDELEEIDFYIAVPEHTKFKDGISTVNLGSTYDAININDKTYSVYKLFGMEYNLTMYIDPSYNPTPGPIPNPTYTITFKNGEEIVSTISDVTGTVIEVPTGLSKEGFTFKGWSTNGTNVIIPVSNIGTEDIIYIAVWEENQQEPDPTYTITFKNGEETVSTISGVTGTAVEVPTGLLKEGFTFKGWSTNGTNVIIPVSNIGTEDIIYIAVWEENQQEPVQPSDIYWYLGLTQPTDNTVITDELAENANSLGWHFIGSILGTYSATNPLNQNTESFKLDEDFDDVTYYVALPGSLKVYDGLGRVVNYDNLGTCTIDGVQYTIYQGLGSEFGFKIY